MFNEDIILFFLPLIESFNDWFFFQARLMIYLVIQHFSIFFKIYILIVIQPPFLSVNYIIVLRIYANLAVLPNFLFYLLIYIPF